MIQSSRPLLECVPNFSEGRDQAVIQQIAAAADAVPGARLLHSDSSPAANRTVLTIAGEPESVCAAVYEAVKAAGALIDMRMQTGVHPRVGAADVVPLIPLAGLSVEEADVYARALAARIGKELDIPVYLYEHSQPLKYRRALPDIRKGQYEGLSARMGTPEWQPDFGPVTGNAKTGATVLGVRNLLIAFNISLDTNDVNKAIWIAERLRTRGYSTTKNGIITRHGGALSKTRAIGWFMEDYDDAQVSLNLLDYRVTSALTAFETCAALAASIGVQIKGSEVIGLIPEAAIIEAGTFALLRADLPVPENKRMIIEAGIEHMKLRALKPFIPEEKILEWRLQSAGLLPISR